MAYQEPKPRSIRLDDDVYEALKKLPESPNKFLRKVLSAGGVFESKTAMTVDYIPSDLRADELVSIANR